MRGWFSGLGHLRSLVDWQWNRRDCCVRHHRRVCTLGFEEHDSGSRSGGGGEGPYSCDRRTGANNTEEAIRLTRDAKRDGADACLLVTPYYNKPPGGLYQHYLAVARAVDIPQILYNVPGRTACDMLPKPWSA